MGAFFCHGNHSFDPTCPQNLMQPFPYPSDATHRIRSRLAEWLQRYSSLKVWTTTDGRRTIGTMYTISSHCDPSEGVRLGCSNPPFSTFYFIFMGNFEHKLCKLIKSNPPLQIWIYPKTIDSPLRKPYSEVKQYFFFFFFFLTLFTVWLVPKKTQKKKKKTLLWSLTFKCFYFKCQFNIKS